MRTFLLSVTAICIVVVAVGCQPAKKQAEPKDQPAKTGSETKEAVETLSPEPTALPLLTPPEAPASKPAPTAKTPEPAPKPAPVANGSNGKAG